MGIGKMTDKDDIKREPVPSPSEIKEVVENIQSEDSKKLQESFKPYIERACAHTTFFVRNSLDPELREYLFPSLDIDRVIEYDFSKSNIEVYVLNKEDNEKFNKQRGYDLETLATAFTRKESKGYTGTEKPLLVFGFVPPKKREEISNEENIILGKMSLISAFNHELLHILGLNTSRIPFALTEGLVEFLAQTITKKDEYFAKYPHLHRYLPVAYGSVTVAISILVNTLVRNDLPLSTVIRGFGKGETDSLITVSRKIAEVYGEEFSLKLPRVAEDTPYELLEYIKKAQAK